MLGLLSFQSGCKTFIVTLLTGSDMSVINSGPKRKDYSDHSSYSYSRIGPKERALNMLLLSQARSFIEYQTHTRDLDAIIPLAVEFIN